MDRFDKELKDKLNIELENIILSENVILKIREQVKQEKKFSIKDTLADLLNYEIRIPYSTCIAGIALIAFFSINSLTVTDKDVVSYMNRNIIKITEYWEEAN